MKTTLLGLSLLFSISGYAEIIDLNPTPEVKDYFTVSGSSYYDSQCVNCGSRSFHKKRAKEKAKQAAIEECKRLSAQSLEILDSEMDSTRSKDYLLGIGAPTRYKVTLKVRCLF